MKGICFVAHNAYGAMAGGREGHVGGVERQTSLMGRWLAAGGYHVSVLTWDEGQEKESVIDGVRVIKMCRRDAGLQGLRFFHPRWFSLNRAMEMADADLYYQNCAEYVTGQVALWCRRQGRRFVFSVASDTDCDPRLPELRTLRERILYRYGVRRADCVLVQTRKQQRMLVDGFGVKSILMPMPCFGPTDMYAEATNARNASEYRVIWVGRISRVKRLDLLLDIAKAMPDIQFDVVGGPDTEESYAIDILERAKRLSNVVVHGSVERDRMPDMYSRASVLCCTSAYEGFPNTFLEAWSHGLPVVSTVDPDDLIAERNLGVTARNKDAMVAALTLLRDCPDRYREMKKNARGYYLENHAVDSVMCKFESLFRDIIAQSRRPGDQKRT